MAGEIRIGSWRRFTARQVLRAFDGFVWAATARVAGLPVTGFDRYRDGDGSQRWRLLGAVPVMSAGGPDVSRSAAGRLVRESFLVPAAFLAAQGRWTARDDGRATAHVPVGGLEHAVTMDVSDAGELRSLSFPRWGKPDTAPAAEHVFGALLDEPVTFGPYVVPTRVRAGGWPGTQRWSDGEFIRYRVTDAAYR